MLKCLPRGTDQYFHAPNSIFVVHKLRMHVLWHVLLVSLTVYKCCVSLSKFVNKLIGSGSLVEVSGLRGRLSSTLIRVSWYSFDRADQSNSCTYTYTSRSECCLPVEVSLVAMVVCGVVNWVTVESLSLTSARNVVVSRSISTKRWVWESES